MYKIGNGGDIHVEMGAKMTSPDIFDELMKQGGGDPAIYYIPSELKGQKACTSDGPASNFRSTDLRHLCNSAATNTTENENIHNNISK